MSFFKKKEIVRVATSIRDTVRDMGVDCVLDEVTLYDVCTDYLLEVDDPNKLINIQPKLEAGVRVVLQRNDIIVKVPAPDTDNKILIMLNGPLTDKDDGPSIWDMFLMLIRRE